MPLRNQVLGHNVLAVEIVGGDGIGGAVVDIEIKENKIKKQIIVCESGKTCSVIMSDFDKAYDEKSQKPGSAFIEKQCAGGYLGPVAFEMLKMAVGDGLFSKAFAEKLSELKSLSLIEFDSYLHNPYDKNNVLGKIACEKATEDDYAVLYELLDALVERSSRAASAILSAAVIQTGEGKNPCRPVMILADGSTFWKSTRIYERVNAYLEEVLTVGKGLYWKISSCDNDITLGSAIAGLL